jgi:hypothetical protein
MLPQTKKRQVPIITPHPPDYTTDIAYGFVTCMSELDSEVMISLFVPARRSKIDVGRFALELAEQST